MMGQCLAWVGRQVIAGGTYARDIMAISYFSFRELFITPASRRRTMFRVMSQQLVFTGVDALPMIGIVALLLGSVMIIQAGVSLHTVGAEDLLGTMMVVVLIRELGPLLTAFVVIGRSGAAICTELGDLRVGMQIKTLHAMGIRIVAFVVLPRMMAVVLAMICLTIYFDLIAVVGGIAVAKFTLGAPFSLFFDTLERSLGLTDVLITGLKGGLFGLVVAAICCHHGLSVQHAAAEVPQATMRAILGSVTVCVLLDLLLIVIVGVSFI
ncbi:MAG TPA: ABC transporter permease [Nitrospirales bacterium]|jgi:phospholipid/cholesterol/gamma-HCH transport system permease protein|nr:ABC transporter permease [Nitrospirales bacterium]HIA14740.1 ABC transporter permease [Nitrospirales bacterium]HIB53805.1 ABC transporter permease [Nitrospirales bacterium]HIC04903.1 ABC transporter permease [Nitrospirales bacterium]HIN32868.1 ABC transporter permease [Nitrospirales bacterium]